MKVEVALSEEEVLNIVTTYLKTKFRCVDDVKIDVGVTYKVVNQVNSYSVGKFNAIKAKVEI
jgi:hypothetical protein